MKLLHSLLSTAFDMVLSPFSNDPLVILLAVSAVSGFVMAVVFRYTSNQSALRRAVDRASAELLAIKLFKDDPWGTLVSLKELLKFISLRLWYSLPPLLVMAIPVGLLLWQLALRFDHSPALPHESILLEAVLSEEAWPQHDQLILGVPSSIQLEAGPHRDAEKKTLTWRLKASEPGEMKLEFSLAGELIGGPLSVSASRTTLMPVRSVINQRSGASVESIQIHYPNRSTLLFGYDLPWWLTFLLVAMLAALLARPLVKVQF